MYVDAKYVTELRNTVMTCIDFAQDEVYSGGHVGPLRLNDLLCMYEVRGVLNFMLENRSFGFDSRRYLERTIPDINRWATKVVKNQRGDEFDVAVHTLARSLSEALLK